VTLLVHGASGLGKSELLRAGGREILAREKRASLLWGRCNERESLSYKAFDGVVDTLGRNLLRLSDVELGQLIPRNMDLLARVFPVLAYLRELDATGRARGRQMLDLQEVRSLAFQALRELLTRLADRRPVVLVLDDIQWADEDSLKLLRAIVQPPEPPPVLLVISMRTPTDPDEAAAAVSHFLGMLPCPAEDLPLAPLSMEDAATLAEELVASNSDTLAPDATQAALIAQEAAGHPLFIHELVHHIQSRPAGGLHQVLRLDDVLWERIRDLEEPLRKLVEVVSISFGPLRQEIVAMALGLHPAEIFRMAARLRVLHLVRTSGPGPEDLVEPYHDRVREAVQARMDDNTRLLIHRSLVKVLRSMRNVEPERLAAHLEIIGENSQAAELVAEAADQAAVALAFNRAADLYKDAIGLRRDDGRDPDPESLRDLHLRMGTALANAGRGRDAAYAFLEAVPGARPVEAVELKRKAANQLLLSGFIDEGLVLTDQILEAVGKRMPKSNLGILSSLLWGRFRVRLAGSRFKERDESLIPPADIVYVDILKSIALGLGGADHIRGAYFNTRFLSAALRLGEPSRVLNALCAEANYAAANAPDSGHARAILASCETIQQRLRDPQSEMYIAGAHAFASFMRGLWADARRHSEDFIRNSMQFNGTAWERDLMNNQVIWCLFYLGELGEMSRRNVAVLHDAVDRGDLFAAAGMVLGLGNVVILNRDGPGEAVREIDNLMARWSVNGYHLQHYWALLSRVNVLIYSGDAQGAHELIWQEWPQLKRSLLTQIPAVRHEGLHCRTRATLSRAAREPGRLRSRLLKQANKDIAALLAVKLAWVRALGMLLDAARRLQFGDRNAALMILARAITQLDTCGMQLYAAAARVRFGRLVGGPDGQAMLQAALEFMRTQGVTDPERMTELLASGFPDEPGTP
jgi:hypothetical protein